MLARPVDVGPSRSSGAHASASPSRRGLGVSRVPQPHRTGASRPSKSASSLPAREPDPQTLPIVVRARPGGHARRRARRARQDRARVGQGLPGVEDDPAGAPRRSGLVEAWHDRQFSIKARAKFSKSASGPRSRRPPRRPGLVGDDGAQAPSPSAREPHAPHDSMPESGAPPPRPRVDARRSSSPAPRDSTLRMGRRPPSLRSPDPPGGPNTVRRSCRSPAPWSAPARRGARWCRANGPCRGWR